MNFEIIPDNTQPAALMGPNDLIKLLPTAAYDALDSMSVRLWCLLNARYGLPTVELIAWLNDYIGGRSAIEIGSGSGDLAHHLGIPGTDNKFQTEPNIAAYYRLLKQPTIHYPSWIAKLDALEAVKQYRPAVVVASWVTHWIDPDQDLPPGGGCTFGVHEDQLLATGVTYVFIGNMNVHGHKPILTQPHRELILPFLRSRAIDPSQNCVLIWNE